MITRIFQKFIDPPRGVASAGRILLGLLFFASGLHKSAAPHQEFAVVIEGYRIVSQDMALFAALILPPIEVLVGLMLISGYVCRLSAAGAGSLLLFFFSVLGSTIIRKIPLENCGCFGGGIHLTPAQAMSFDGFLIVLAFWAYRKGSDYALLDGWIRRGK